MTASRFHDHPDLDFFAAQNSIVERVAIGSALKYGVLVAAEVDVFPRLVGSSGWDTAAGQAVLKAAGGQVLDWHTEPCSIASHDAEIPGYWRYAHPAAEKNSN
jgi:3'(2'), 5'-bisphosphate nucleotidase